MNKSLIYCVAAIVIGVFYTINMVEAIGKPKDVKNARTEALTGGPIHGLETDFTPLMQYLNDWQKRDRKVFLDHMKLATDFFKKIKDIDKLISAADEMAKAKEEGKSTDELLSIFEKGIKEAFQIKAVDYSFLHEILPMIYEGHNALLGSGSLGGVGDFDREMYSYDFSERARLVLGAYRMYAICYMIRILFDKPEYSSPDVVPNERERSFSEEACDTDSDVKELYLDWSIKIIKSLKKENRIKEYMEDFCRWADAH